MKYILTISILCLVYSANGQRKRWNDTLYIPVTILTKYSVDGKEYTDRAFGISVEKFIIFRCPCPPKRQKLFYTNYAGDPIPDSSIVKIFGEGWFNERKNKKP